MAPSLASHSSRMLELQIEALVPPAIAWTGEQCVAWLYVVGLPQYEECFTTNLITGKKLILLDVSRLNKLGIQDFDHLKTLAAGIRELLNLPRPNYFQTISLPHHEPLGMYLECRSRTGKNYDRISYVNWLKSNDKLLAHCYGHKVDPFNPENRKVRAE